MELSTKKAKEHCGYQPKPILPTCRNCAAFASDMVVPQWFSERHPSGIAHGKPVSEYAQEKNLRCTDHGFAVKKMASCKLWKPTPTGATK